MHDRMAAPLRRHEPGFAKHGEMPRDASDAQPGSMGDLARRERRVEHREQARPGAADQGRERLRADSRLGLPQRADSPRGIGDGRFRRRPEERRDEGPDECAREKEQPGVVNVDLVVCLGRRVGGPDYDPPVLPRDALVEVVEDGHRAAGPERSRSIDEVAFEHVTETRPVVGERSLPVGIEQLDEAVDAGAGLLVQLSSPAGSDSA